MSLSTILKEIETHRPNSLIDVDKGPKEMYGGRRGLKLNATESIKRLRLQFRTELMAQVAFIVVTGSNRDKFTEVASTDEFGCFSVDPDDFFKDLTSRIDKTLFGRETTRNLFNIATNVLEDKALELDINSYPMLHFGEKYNTTARTPEEFVPIIRNAVTEQVGSELVGVNAVYSVVDKAIEKGYNATVTPIILNTPDEQFALDLFKNLKKHTHTDGMSRGLTSKVFLVAAGKTSKELKGTLGAFAVKDANESSVGQTLTAIRSKIVS